MDVSNHKTSHYEDKDDVYELALSDIVISDDDNNDDSYSNLDGMELAVSGSNEGKVV